MNRWFVFAIVALAAAWGLPLLLGNGIHAGDLVTTVQGSANFLSYLAVRVFGGLILLLALLGSFIWAATN